LFNRRKRDYEDNENLERWLLTYADLITLLLAFFIVMYSISQVDSKKFGKMKSALTSVFKGPEMKPASARDLSSGLIVNRLLRNGNLGVLEEQIRKISVQLDLKTQLNTEIQTRGLVIHISESAFFDPGKAELKPEARTILDLISVQLLKIPNDIRVEGHTDNIPINTEKYPSNWELSASRAAVCLRYLIDKLNFPPERISAVGYAEYRPIAPNDTPENMAKNRRVDIVVLDREESLFEPENLIDNNFVSPQDSMIQTPSGL
jgi:chemotaxis protein MotB